LDAAPGTVILQRCVEDIVEIARQFKTIGVEGVVVLGPTPEGLMARLQNLSIPFVSIKTSEMGSDSYREFDFSTDVYGGGRLAGRHFLSHGHRKAIFFCSHLKTNRYKFEGLKKSWLEAGLHLEHCVEIEGMSLNEEEVIRQFCTLVHKHGFTACLASNDFIAARLMQHLRVAGIRVPDDLAVIGFDGNHFVPLLAPSLTSVIQDYRETSVKAGRLLLQRIDEFAATDSQTIQEEYAVMPKLFIGGSCGCDVTPDPLMKWTTEDRDLTAFYADKLITHC
jgi:DNA-binding LacI/PurR family transcriptional regulator